MSVINKMLQDLEHRQDGPSANPAAAGASTNVPANSSRSPLVIGLLVLIVLLLCFISWQVFVDRAPQASVVTSQTIPEPHQEATAPKPKLAEAKPQLTESAETKPQNTLSQNEPAAQTPIDKVDTEQALAKVLSATESEKLKTAEQVSTSTDRVHVTHVQAGVVVPTEPAIQPAANLEMVTTAVTPQPPQEPQGVFSIEKSSTRMTPEERVAKLFKQAQASFDKGYISEAIEKFNTVLNVQDNHIEARNMLAVAWYGRGETQQAVRVLNDGLKRYPNVESWRLTAAKIFFKENNPQGAFSYLNLDLAQMSKEFLTMKGTLARQLKQFVAAESVYLRLTKMEPNVGNWWLGLAISQDSQGKSTPAITSYESVLQVGGVSAPSLDFAKQRIEELKG